MTEGDCAACMSGENTTSHPHPEPSAPAKANPIFLRHGCGGWIARDAVLDGSDEFGVGLNCLRCGQRFMASEIATTGQLIGKEEPE